MLSLVFSSGVPSRYQISCLKENFFCFSVEYRLHLFLISNQVIPDFVSVFTRFNYFVQYTYQSIRFFLSFLKERNHWFSQLSRKQCLSSINQFIGGLSSRSLGSDSNCPEGKLQLHIPVLLIFSDCLLQDPDQCIV